MFISLFILIFGFSSFAFNMQSYQEREKAFLEWQAAQERADLQRKKEGDKQKILRMQRELEAIRRRKQFRREYRTTAPLEAEYLAKIANKKDNRAQDREAFSRERKALIQYYEKNVLPLKNKEYGLEKLPPVEETVK